jgi:hypothetical protein
MFFHDFKMITAITYNMHHFRSSASAVYRVGVGFFLGGGGVIVIEYSYW